MNPNFTAAATLAIENRARMLADNLTNANAVLRQLSKRGKIEQFDGGLSIFKELLIKENEAAGSFHGYEKLSVAPTDMYTPANFEIRQYYSNVVFSGFDLIQNAGRSRMINMVKARTEGAMATMKNNIDEGLVSAGTGNDGKEIDGLQAMLPTSTNTGTYGGISRANTPGWRHYYSAHGTTVRADLTEAMIKLQRGTDKTDLILIDNEGYVALHGELQAQQRFASEDSAMAKAGFRALMYDGVEVVAEAMGGNVPNNTAFLLNCGYLHYQPHSGTNMKVDRRRASHDQDAYVIPIFWAGNLTCSGLKFQGRVATA